MQKLEDHTPLFVRIPGSLFDAAHAEAKRRQVVLRVVITEALRERFEPGPLSEQPPPRPSPSSLSHSRVVSALVGDEIRAAAAGRSPRTSSKMDQIRALRAEKA